MPCRLLRRLAGVLAILDFLLGLGDRDEAGVQPFGSLAVVDRDL